ncbi:hypothetical protein ACJ6TS_09340 [Citrobacter telavivensis]
MVALPAGLGGGLLAAATPELAAAAQAVLAGCQSAAILCLNQAGILTAEVATPGGVGAAGSLTVGKNAAEIAAAKAEVTAVNSAKPAGCRMFRLVISLTRNSLKIIRIMNCM